jgi:hypothetical protein
MRTESITRVLESVHIETERFLVKLEKAKARIDADSRSAYGCKETGALRRAALDLKNELTRITQSSGY